VAEDDLAAGFGTLSVTSTDGDNEDEPLYVQLNSSNGRTFRPYRIVKREDGQLALYSHAALYQAERVIDRAKGTSATPSTEGLINELIAIGRVQGGLLPPRGSELRGAHPVDRIRAERYRRHGTHAAGPRSRPPEPWTCPCSRARSRLGRRRRLARLGRALSAACHGQL
jgi:hypothetical protein